MRASVCALVPLALVVCQELSRAGPPQRKRPAPRQPATKQSAPREELRVIVARRIARATGLEVTIDDLVYELFRSTFKASGISVGPSPSGKPPYLKVARVRAKVPIFKGGSARHVSLVRVRSPHAVIPGAVLSRLCRRRGGRPAVVARAEVKDGILSIGLGRGKRVTLRGIALRARRLRLVPARGKTGPLIHGHVELTADAVELPGLILGSLSLRGSLSRGKLEVERLSLGLGGGGRVELTGRTNLGCGGVGPVTMKGTVKGRLWGREVTGKLRVTGRLVEGLRVSGELVPAAGSKLPRRGGARRAPPIRLRMRVDGGGRLQGSLRRWRIR